VQKIRRFSLSVNIKTFRKKIRNQTIPLQTLEDSKYSEPKPRSRKAYLTQVFLTSAPLLISDLLATTASCLFAILSHRWLDLIPELELIAIVPYLALILVVVYFMFGLYPGNGLSPIFEFRQIAVSTTLVFTGFFIASLSLNTYVFTTLLVTALLISLITIPVMRFISRRIFCNFHWWGLPVLIFGGQKAASNYEYLSSRPYFGLRPLGIIGQPGSYPYLGGFEMASTIANRNGIFWAIVALPEQSSQEILWLVRKYVRYFPHVFFVSNLEEFPSLWNRSFDLGNIHGISIHSNLLLPLPRFVKRLVDLAMVITLGLITFPLWAAIVLLVKYSSPGPVFFAQERIGYKGRRFKTWKFRTMVTNGDQLLHECMKNDPALREEWMRNQKLKNDPRVTGIGRWLRKTSLDELPQLWNILSGEMSMVGPRPIIENEIERYGDCFSLYKRVVPGLTGLWQISGRNNTTYQERVRLDGYYVRNWSPWMDIYILARTLKVVLFHEGAY
jgi:Undecaprenyl-phosphate galactose phosphotransferase WbaP